MSQAFSGRFTLVDDTAHPSLPPVEYAEWVRERLGTIGAHDAGIIRIRQPRPTAAFSPQDRAHADYHNIAAAMQARGFAPIERGTGGRLTVFDENAIGVTVIAPHADPHVFMMERYDVFSAVIAACLKALGIDARIGELPNEYCPGKFSINAGGRVKLVGIAQRMNKRAYQMGAVIAIKPSAPARAAIADAYGAMGLDFDPATYGGISDFNETADHRAVAAVLAEKLQEMTQ